MGHVEQACAALPVFIEDQQSETSGYGPGYNVEL